jgi:hypothetical protein
MLIHRPSDRQDAPSATSMPSLVGGDQPGAVRAARETGAHGMPRCWSCRGIYRPVAQQDQSTLPCSPGTEAVVPMESTGLELLETLSAVRNATPERIGNLPAHSPRAKQAGLGLNARVESTGLNRHPLTQLRGTGFLSFGTYQPVPRSSRPAYRLGRLQQHLLVPWNLPARARGYPVESTGQANIGRIYRYE